MKKIKVLYYGDSPTCASGFGTVSRNILEQLWKTGDYDISVLAINYHGGWHPSGLVERYKIDCAINNPQRDLFGTDKLIWYVQHGGFDVLISLHNLEQNVIQTVAKLYETTRQAAADNPDKKFAPLPKWIHYFPIDGETCPAHEYPLRQIDFPVCYCDFAFDKVIKEHPFVKGKLRKIPHGINPEDYFPPENPEDKAAAKERILGKEYRDKFLVTNINRFIQRKDVPRTLLAFREFKKAVPDSMLYPHCSCYGEEMGNMEQHAKATGLDMRDVVLNDPNYFNLNQGYPISGMRRIYHASDLIMSTSLGEGWGFSCTEAMACKVPVLMPRNTSFIEIVGKDEERGWLIDSGKDIDDWIVMPEDNGLWRPLSSVRSAVEKMVYIRNHPEEAAAKAEKAFEWIEALKWESVCKAWIGLIKQAVGGAK